MAEDQPQTDNAISMEQKLGMARKMLTGLKPGSDPSKIDESNVDSYIPILKKMEIGQEPGLQGGLQALPGASEAIQGAIRVAKPVVDYYTGIQRTGLAGYGNVYNAMHGDPNPVMKPEDVKSALYGNAPSAEEYAARLHGYTPGPPASQWPVVGKAFNQPGAPDADKHWYKPNAGGPLDVTPGGLVTGAIDLAPAPEFGFESKLFGLGGHALSNASEAGGKKLYQSAFSDIDKDLIEAGKPTLSDKLYERGVVGGDQTALDATKQMHNELGEKIGDYDRQIQISEAEREAKKLPPVPPVPVHEAFGPALEDMERPTSTIDPKTGRTLRKGKLLSASRSTRDEAAKEAVGLRADMENIADQGGLQTSDAIDAKRDFQDKASPAYVPSNAKLGMKEANAVKVAKGIRQQVNDQIQKYGSLLGLSDQEIADYASTNELYGSTEMAIPRMKISAGQAPSTGDIISGLLDYKLSRVKKALPGSTAARTTLGYYGSKAGQYGLPDMAARFGLLQGQNALDLSQGGTQ